MIHLKDLIEEIKIQKTNLMKKNEHHIVKLCFYLAKRLLMKEVEGNDEYITTVIKRSLEMAQSEEAVTVKMSAEDCRWVNEHKETIFKNLNLDESTKLEEDPDISRGGVVVETNYGVIDSTLEQRVEKLESLLDGQMDG